MKISRKALQKYFKAPLPSERDIAEAFTFHAFEIDSIENDVLDVKVLPNRAADCNSEEGLARELSAILDVPLKDPAARYEASPVSVSLPRINAILGTNFSAGDIENVFRRLRFKAEASGEGYRVTAPFPRTDITLAEDIAEEVAQILGYDTVPSAELPPAKVPADQDRFRGIERMKDALVEQGYIEVSTQSFAKKGDVELANPMDKSKPALRVSLEAGLAEALSRAKQYAPLALPPKVEPKLFEVGTVFPKAGEYLELRMTEPVKAWGTPPVDNLSVAKLESYGKGYEPKRYRLGEYRPFSNYPFIQRDIALWVPEGTGAENVLALIREHAGELLVRSELFDEFKKDGRVSYAFRLIFQSFDSTLTDFDANERVESVSKALTAKGWQVR